MTTGHTASSSAGAVAGRSRWRSTRHDNLLTQRGFRVPDGLPDMDAVAAARAHGRDVRTTSRVSAGLRSGGAPTTIQTPVRILTENVQAADGETYAVQIVGDRIAEQRTLDVMLAVLLIGGMVVVLVAFGFGTVYARRALVPIRESLANQRVALRRQREFAADASHELRTPLTVIRSSVEHLERHRDEPVAIGRLGARGHRRRGPPHDRDRRGPAAARPLRFGGRRARARAGRPRRRRRRRRVGDGQARDRPRGPGRGRSAAGGRRRRSGTAPPAGDDPGRQRHPPQPGRTAGSGWRCGPTGAGASLVVEDDGPGIRPEDMPHVFERFYRAPGAPGGGTGLGLAIAEWIVDRHGGRIEVANRAEGGARFVVDLPATGVAPV